MAVCKLINLMLILIGILILPITTVGSAAVVVLAPVRTLTNITVTKVVTATEATTTTQSALLTCTTLAAPLGTAPCAPRKKRQLWGVPVFYTVAREDIDQFHSLNPTHVFKVEPSALQVSPDEEIGDGEVRAGVWVPIVVDAVRRRPPPVEVEPSFDGIRSPSAEAFRNFADPHLFSALLSSLLSGWQFPTIAVVTATRTVYTATSTATLFTSTSVHTLSAAACLPADFVSCPWEAEEAPATDDPAAEIPTTDVL